MPANIDSYIGRLPAWHRLGTVTGEYMNVETIFRDGGLDYEVAKIQLEHMGFPVEAWGIFRNDNGEFLGSVGADYEPIQHREGFAFLDHIVGSENGAHFETAGSLGRGETVWGLIDLGLVSGIKGTQDQSNNYLFARLEDSSWLRIARDQEHERYTPLAHQWVSTADFGLMVREFMTFLNKPEMGPYFELLPIVEPPPTPQG